MDGTRGAPKQPAATGDSRANGKGSSQRDTTRLEELPRKRKSRGDGADTTPQPEPEFGESKKLKLDNRGRLETTGSRTAAMRAEDLPPEIWHRVFTFCPPRTLGSLLCVNKLFSFYLNPSSDMPPTVPPSSKSAAKQLKPNAIWQAARRLFWPFNPGPLKDMTELEMWRLACSLSCQFCGKQDSRHLLPSTDPMRFGPGADGVACIWAFRVRCCGRCLSYRSIKEMDFLMSDVPSFLMPALPFVFSTPDLHTVPPSLMGRSQFPLSLSLTKLFLASDVDSLHKEFLAAKELGTHAVEEWQKGLSLRGQEQRADVVKWERFTDFGGLGTMRSLLYPGYETAAAPAAAVVIALPDASRAQTQTQKQTQAQAQAKQAKQARQASLPGGVTLPPRPTVFSQAKMNQLASVPAYGPSYEPSLSLPAKVSGVSRPMRTREDIDRLKVARKAEIVRRARQMNPPMTEAILEQTSAFRAAIQIITPLDNTAWKALKLRLQAQKKQLEESRVQAAPPKPPTPIPRPKTSNIPLEQTKGETNAEWDEIQGPVRFKILKYADEVVKDWDNGEKVNKINAADFAADVLSHVRKRFYTQIESEAKAASARGQKPRVDPPKGPFTQKLTLENMKYAFDMRVRPLTDTLSRELFLCAGCEITAGSKLYALEGVIQHYAAKHTERLSLGPVVVHWRAEWPVEPMFLTRKEAMKISRDLGTKQYLQTSPAPVSLFNSARGTLPPVPALGTHTAPALMMPAPPPYMPAYPVFPAAHQPPFQIVPCQNAPFPTSQRILEPQEQPPPRQAPPLGTSQLPQTVTRQATWSNRRLDKRSEESAPSTGGSGTRHANTAEDLSQRYDALNKKVNLLWRKTKSWGGSDRSLKILSALDLFYKSKYGQPLPFSVFFGGMTGNGHMRALQNIEGNACKACLIKSEHYGKRKLTLLKLARHFQDTHLAAQDTDGRGPTNWIADMLDASPQSGQGRAPADPSGAVLEPKNKGKRDTFARAENPGHGEKRIIADGGGPCNSHQLHPRSESTALQHRPEKNVQPSGGRKSDETNAPGEQRQGGSSGAVPKEDKTQTKQTKSSARVNKTGGTAAGQPRVGSVKVEEKNAQSVKDVPRAPPRRRASENPENDLLSALEKSLSQPQDGQTRPNTAGTARHGLRAPGFYVDVRGHEVARYKPPRLENGRDTGRRGAAEPRSRRSRSPPRSRNSGLAGAGAEAPGSSVSRPARSPFGQRPGSESVNGAWADNAVVPYRRYERAGPPVSYGQAQPQQPQQHQPEYYRVYLDGQSQGRLNEYDVRVQRPDNSEYYLRMSADREMMDYAAAAPPYGNGPGGRGALPPYRSTGYDRAVSANGTYAYEEYDPRRLSRY